MDDFFSEYTKIAMTGREYKRPARVVLCNEKLIFNFQNDFRGNGGFSSRGEFAGEVEGLFLVDGLPAKRINQ